MTKQSAYRITIWFFLMAAAQNLSSFGQGSGSRHARAIAFPVAQASLGFTGEWSDGSSWLTIINDGEKFVGVYPSGKDVEVLRGEILPNRQLKLVTVRYGKLFNPLQSYEGDFDNQAWLELASDQNSVTVRFRETKGGRSLVLKRISGGSNAKGSEPETTSSAVASISVGTSHTCYVTTGGAGYCWGDGKGANSNGTTARTPAPASIVGDLNLSSVSAGYYFTCWVTTDGSAYCAGSNENGQLGSGKPRVGTERGSEYIGSAVPAAVAGGLKFSIVSAGQQHACGLTTDGLAYCWGDNSHEQLGNIDKVWTTNDSVFIDNRYGSKSADSAKPFPVGGGLRFATLSAGAAHTCAVTATGAAYCWGEGSHGELGNGGTARSARPVAVAGGLSFASLTASKTATFTCGLTTSGAAYCWGLVGDNDSMQLGNGQTGSSLVPVAVAGGLSFTVLSAGAEHVCGITTGGAAYCWGTGGWGILGTGTEKDALTPVPVSGNLKFASISSGDHHTCGLTTAGVVYCWGSNSYDELGGATRANRSSVPVAVGSVQKDDYGFEAFFRVFSAAVRTRNRVTLESMMSPTLEFPVDVRSPSMALDYLGYKGGEGWKQLEESVTTGTKPYKDPSPNPVTRVTEDNWVLFARGADGKWRWLRFGIP